jgi:hypothetical protein
VGLAESASHDGVGWYSSADQGVPHGSGALLGKPLVVGVATFVIGVAVDFEMQARVRTHNGCDATQPVETAAA